MTTADVSPVAFTRNSLEDTAPGTPDESIHEDETPKLKDAQPEKRSRWRIPIIFRSWWWWWEVGAAALSLTCIILIFVALREMHDQPLSKWKLAISINTAVSILATVGKSALMLLVAETISHLKWVHFKKTRSLRDVQAFDEASRGPYGAATFAWKTRGNAWLAPVACFVAITSLGFEPAAQQMLSFPQRTVPSSSGEANLLRANGFEFSYLEWVAALGLTSDNDLRPPLQMQLQVMASYAGAVRDAPYTCSTSACFFGDISTTAVCESCQNMTGQVKRETWISPDSTLNRSYTFRADDPFFSPVTMNFTYSEGAQQTGFGIAGNYAWLANDNATRLGPRRASLFAVDVQRQSYENMDLITACDFSWCTRTYRNSSIINGQFRYDREDRAILDNITQRIDPAEANLVNVSPIMESLKVTSKADKNAMEYRISRYADETLWAFVTSTLSGTANNNTQTRQVSSIPLAETAANISLAVSNYMREASNTNGVSVTGDASESVTFVHVNWPWLTWPLALTLIGSLVLLASLIQKPPSQTLLKSSALGLLFHGLSGFEMNEKTPLLGKGQIEDNDTLERMAKAIKVRLAHDEDGVLSFVKQ